MHLIETPVTVSASITLAFVNNRLLSNKMPLNILNIPSLCCFYINLEIKCEIMTI